MTCLTRSVAVLLAVLAMQGRSAVLGSDAALIHHEHFVLFEINRLRAGQRLSQGALLNCS